ncbi:cupredoxin domain-containing protein [Arthrobacter sp. ISL-69]|uniref:cupredoxin domain-containing protein n=1 Tax=Arthrobacter sp. ISL-69 TaxID=2819113 RepID=UPI001BE583F7|nr:cupredoxin domain-containing protein [Arthrobacter sp. ISL-69]MBT2538463.1 cupredoxin domain-containing protein [Arthrobacter sp. ISL-69]
MTTRTAWALGTAAAVIALSGCGNGNPTGPGTGSSASPARTTEQSASVPPADTTRTQAATPPAETPSGGAASAEILIKGFKYQGPETVAPGTLITVINEDTEAHTITADTGAAFDAVIKVGTGTFTAPTEPGTYSYHCIFHANMHGTLTVK